MPSIEINYGSYIEPGPPPLRESPLGNKRKARVIKSGEPLGDSKPAIINDTRIKPLAKGFRGERATQRVNAIVDESLGRPVQETAITGKISGQKEMTDFEVAALRADHHPSPQKTKAAAKSEYKGLFKPKDSTETVM